MPYFVKQDVLICFRFFSIFADNMDKFLNSLGNVYAGCLYEALITELGDIEADLARGDLSRPLQWLSEHLQQFGRSRPAHELIETATGKAASVTPLVTYIQRKFSDLYAL